MKAFVKYLIVLVLFFPGAGSMAQAPNENDYWKILKLPLPEGVVLEAGGVCSLPNGNIAVSTRRGDIYIVENPLSTRPVFRKFAEGLHEVLGLKFVDNAFYCAQRSELTRVSDRNGDGKADRYETVFSWPLSGNYHEYSFGPEIAPDGSMFVTLNIGFFSPDWWRGRSKAPWRGWALKIDPTDGSLEPFATGMRSPCGIGMIDGELFYADNQGDWIGSGSLVHLEKGNFVGHPAGLEWADSTISPVNISMEDVFANVDPRIPAEGEPLGMLPNLEDETPYPFYQLKEKFDDVKPPTVWLPHGVLGTSTSDILKIETNGAFGPFEGQVLIGDQGQSKISRVMLEKVKGEYQGASILFREGFSSGVLRLAWANDNSLFVGQTSRGWGSTGQESYALERLVWTGRMPFEMKNIKAKADGFEIEFTQPVDKASAENLENYSVSNFIYKYHPVYGSPAVNQKSNAIEGIKVSDDGTKVRIAINGLREKYIHELILNVKNENGDPLLHSTAYYTLNNIPEGEKMAISKPSRSSSNATKTTTVKQSPPKPKVREKLGKNVTKMPASWSKPDRIVKMATKPGLKFSIEKITVKAGERVQLDFDNPDDMPHNLLIVKEGTARTVGEQALKLGIKGASMNYVPDTDDVLFHTTLMSPGANESIYFVAPDKPGTYTYVCTYPGHYISMQGTLVVE